MENGDRPVSHDKVEGRANITKEVSSLVMGEVMPFYGAPGWTPEYSAEQWTTVARAYPDHLGMMNRIRNTMRSTIFAIKDNIHVMDLYTRPFPIQDDIARYLLGTVLFSRLGEHRGSQLLSHINNVASDMAGELGLKEGWTGPSAQHLTVEDTVASILDRNLRLVSS